MEGASGDLLIAPIFFSDVGSITVDYLWMERKFWTLSFMFA
jgi:hypothetical protein